MSIIPDPKIQTGHPQWCSRPHCTTLPTGDVDHRAVASTIDARPLDDREVRVAVARYDEGGLLAGATGAELRVVTDDLAEDGSPVVVDVLLAPGTAQAVGLALLRTATDAVHALAAELGDEPSAVATTWGVTW